MANESAPKSLLDHDAVSGRYLFPQDRYVSEPFLVEVHDGDESIQLACYHRCIDDSALTIVHFHGNGECVADYVPDMADAFAKLGLNSLFAEYREYGSSTGKAQLVSMLSDGEAILKAAGIEPQNAIAFGRSIGSLYAIELAHRVPAIGGLILESSIADPCERFLNYAELGAGGYTEEDLRAEAKRHFNHKAKLSGFTNPLLVLHTEEDGLVEISHAERNYKWTKATQKQFVRFPDGNHNTILGINWKEYMSAVASLAKAVKSRAS